MRTAFAALLAVVLGSPVLAGDLTPAATIADALSVFTPSADEPLPLKERIRRNNAHERQAWDGFVSAGGCDGAVVQHDYTITCMRSVFGAPVMGSQGGD